MKRTFENEFKVGDRVEYIGNELQPGHCGIVKGWFDEHSSMIGVLFDNDTQVYGAYAINLRKIEK